mmetsp:Transcript_134140/g.388324  ORF Transcript_134140/g.388324 Transcript_134140/m.388324 type:complete len:302 (-) Transcript_134140:47-952(-)
MPSSESWTRTKQLILASALAFVAGYTDGVSVIRWRSFATMMTGNVLFAGRDLLAHDPAVPHSAPFYALLIASFCLGVVAYRVTEARCPSRGASNLGFALCAIMLTAEIAPIILPSGHSCGHYSMLAFTPMFGMLSASCTSGRLGTATNLVTGHLVVLATFAIKPWLDGSLTTVEWHKARMSSCVLGFTFLGVGCGAALCYIVGGKMHGTLLPVPPCLAILLWFIDHLEKPRSLIKSAQRCARQRRQQKQQPNLSDAEEESTSVANISSDEAMSADSGDDDFDADSISDSEDAERGRPLVAA